MWVEEVDSVVVHLGSEGHPRHSTHCELLPELFPPSCCFGNKVDGLNFHKLRTSFLSQPQTRAIKIAYCTSYVIAYVMWQMRHLGARQDVETRDCTKSFSLAQPAVVNLEKWS